MQTVQRVASTVFVSSLSPLIAFWVDKDLKPSGGAVFPSLYAALIASTATWLLMALLRKRAAAPDHPAESPGSFNISGKKVKNVHMRRNFSNHPGSLGSISGESIANATMEGNVHAPKGGGIARPIVDLTGFNSVENVFIEDCSVEYRDDASEE